MIPANVAPFWAIYQVNAPEMLLAIRRLGMKQQKCHGHEHADLVMN